MGPYQYGDIVQGSQMKCNSQMESNILPIQNKNSPFDKSIESIESTNIYGALQLRRYFSKSRY